MFFIYSDPMINKIVLSFLLVVLPFAAQAGECKYGDLALEFLDVKTFAPTDSYTAQLTGIIEVPTPNYTHTFLFSQEEMKEGILRADLALHIKEPDVMSFQVITPLEINHTIEIPHVAQTLFVDVIKRFHWGAEYFQIHLPDTPQFERFYCLSPEQYKE